MTDPANVIKQGGERYYVWPPEHDSRPREMTVPSVTNIISNGLPKPYLKPWGERMVAEYAMDNLDVLTRLSRDAGVDLCKREPFRFTGAAINRGNLVHAAIDAHANGQPLPGIDDAVAAGKFAGAKRFLDDCVHEIYCAEGTVYSRKHQYAGSADLFALVKLPKWDEPRPAVVDYKTSKKVYDEVGYQLAAYARADFINLSPGNEEDPAVESEMPNVGVGVVVRPTEDGKYEYKSYEITDDLFNVFLAFQIIAEGEGILRGVKGRLGKAA